MLGLVCGTGLSSQQPPWLPSGRVIPRKKTPGSEASEGATDTPPSIMTMPCPAIGASCFPSEAGEKTVVSGRSGTCRQMVDNRC